MTRRLVATLLLISFIAVASSGLMMFVIEKPSFTIRMHPVHKAFGVLLVVAVAAHLTLNWRLLFRHLATRSAMWVGGLLVCMLVGAYVVAARNEVPADLARQMDEAAAKAESASR